MYKPYSGLITQFRLLTGILNAFLKDLFSCLEATMPSKNHLFSLLRNANLICVYSSLVLLTSRDFFAGALFRLFSSSRFTDCLLFSASKLISPRLVHMAFPRMFSKYLLHCKGPLVLQTTHRDLLACQRSCNVRLACKLGNASRNKMTNFVWERVNHVRKHTKLLATCLPHIIIVKRVTCRRLRVHPRR